jgi:hypothetical protein
MLRPILIAVGVLIAILALAVGWFVYRFAREILALGRGSGMPDEIKIARVVLGADRVSKQAFYSAPDLGLITDMEPWQNRELVIVGQRGAAFLKKDAEVDRNVHFQECHSYVVAVDLEPGAFLCRGAWTKPVSLFDSEGKTLWSYDGGGDGIDDAAAGRLGASGTKGVIVGLNGGGGVHWLSPAGERLWKQDDGNVWHVEIVAADDKSENVILHSNAGGELTIRDANGNVLARYTPEIYLAHFALTAWGDSPHVNKLVAAQEDHIYVLTMDGKTVARLPAPGNVGIADPSGTTVHFFGKTPYYAGLLRHRSWSRSLLYIYDEQNRLVYQEVLNQDCASLHAAPRKNGSEDLLVGCDGDVWKYSPRTGSDAPARGL